MALRGVFAASPSGTGSGTPTPVAGSKLRGAFSAPPAPIDQNALALQTKQAAMTQQNAQEAADAAHANSIGGIVSAALPKLSDIWGGIKTTLGDAKTAVVDTFKNAPVQNLDVKASSDDAASTYYKSLVSAGDQMVHGASTVFGDHKSALDRGVGGAEAAIGALNAAFAFPSAAIQYIAHVPGLGTAADAFNALFAAIGSGGSDAVEGTVSALPFSDETKAKIMPVAQQAGAIAAQILAGKVGGEGVTKVAEHTKEILHTAADAVKGGQAVINAPEMTKIPVKGVSEEAPVPVQSQYTPDAQLPEIQVGPKPRATPEDLPVIKTGDETVTPPAVPERPVAPVEPAKPGIAPEDVNREVENHLTTAKQIIDNTPGVDIKAVLDDTKKNLVDGLKAEGMDAPSAAIAAIDTAKYKTLDAYKAAVEKATAEVPRETPIPTKTAVPRETPVRKSTLKPVEGTGDIKTRGLSQGIEAKAIENGLTKTFGDLPEYKTVNMADQAARAADLLEKNYDEARAIALGDKAPPRGLLPESVLVAIEKDAIARGDIETLRELATNSRLTYEATTMGQRIRTLAERDPSSPVGAIKAVQDAREAALKGKEVDVQKETAKDISDMKKQIKKAASKRPTWEEFVKNLTCNI